MRYAWAIEAIENQAIWVFYRKNNNKLEVIRILHKRMDIDSVFESNQS